MKLIRVNETKQRFPDGTESSAVALTFEQDGETVIKRVQISGCAVAVNSGKMNKEAGWLVLKSAREAVRDFAFMKYGPDDWKKHVVWGGFFSGDMSTEEAELVKTAVELLRANSTRADNDR